MTAQITDVKVDNHNWTVEERISAIEESQEYQGHHIVVVPELSDQTELVGGYHVYHGDCCPGRKDAIVLPPTVHIIAVLSTDIPFIQEALEKSRINWPRKARILEKLRSTKGE